MKPNWKCPFCNEVFAHFGLGINGNEELVGHIYNQHKDKLRPDDYVEINN